MPDFFSKPSTHEGSTMQEIMSVEVSGRGRRGEIVFIVSYTGRLHP